MWMMPLHINQKSDYDDEVLRFEFLKIRVLDNLNFHPWISDCVVENSILINGSIQYQCTNFGLISGKRALKNCK